MFDDDWEVDFLFTQNAVGEPICLLCQSNVKRCHKFNVERHYRTCHKEYFEIKNEERKVLISKLKKNISLECNVEEISIEKASYVVSLALSKHCRPYDDGMFFKELTKEVLCCFGSKGKEMSDILEKVPLSRRTITRRTEQISQYIFSLTKKRLENCKYFSLCLDESTDINNICQLIICVKSVDENWNTFEEIFEVAAMHGRVTGEKILEVLQSNVFSCVDTRKLSAICTDGAKVMIGNKKGLVGCLLKKNINVPNFHCIIHQQALFAKELCLNNAMEISIKIINKIKGGHNALNNRKFKSLLDELDSEYEDLLLYTEVRWLSKGKSLLRLFNLRKEVVMFFEENMTPDVQHFVSCLKNNNFLYDLAFLCDITTLINELNCMLQGKNKKIFDLVRAVTHFGRKFKILLNQVKNNDLTNLPNVTEIYNECKIFDKTEDYSKILETLTDNFESRFKDFDIIKTSIDLHDYPLICNVQEQKIELQQELEKMRQDFQIPLETGEHFWKKVSNANYPKLKNEIFKLYSMFGSTYNCESAFSTMKILLNKYRHRLTDQHISDLLRIKNYDDEINIGDVMQFSSVN